MSIFKPGQVPPYKADKVIINRFASKYYSENKQSFNLFKHLCLLNVSTDPHKSRFFVSLCGYIDYETRLDRWETVELIGTVSRKYESDEIDSVLYLIFNKIVHKFNKIENPRSKFQDYVETNMLYGFRNWVRGHYNAIQNVTEVIFNDDLLYDCRRQLFSDEQEIKTLLDHYLYFLGENGATPMLLQIFSEALMGKSLIQTIRENYGIENPANSFLYRNIREHKKEIVNLMVPDYRYDVTLRAFMHTSAN